jgi:hypothetical protein
MAWYNLGYGKNRRAQLDDGRQMLRRMVVRLRKQSGTRLKELTTVSGARLYRRGKGAEGAAPGSACRCLSQTAHGCRGLDTGPDRPG